MIYLLTTTGLSHGGSSTVHIYTQTVHGTTQLIWEECGPCAVFASYTLVFALQLKKKQGKTSVRLAEEYLHKHNNKNTWLTELNKSILNIQPYIVWQKCTKRTWKILITEKAIQAAKFVWSIYLLIMLVTLLLRPKLHFTQLHFTPLHGTFRQFTSSHFNFTQLHFTPLQFFTLHFLPFKLHTTTLHSTSLFDTSIPPI
jgi:hypothetical protein